MSSGHCKVFLDTEDVGHALDISVLRSYEEVYKKLADIFGLERLDMMTRVLYIDATGASRQIGDAPFRCIHCFQYFLFLNSFMSKNISSKKFLSMPSDL